MSRMGWIGDYNDPMTFFDMWLSDSSQNNTNFNNPEYDKLIRDAKATGDQKVRMANMHKAEQIFMDEVPAIPIYYYVSIFLENPKVTDHRVDPLAFLYLQYAYFK
jgi:oligopeptide transport system substrate-binding protein